MRQDGKGGGGRGVVIVASQVNADLLASHPFFTKKNNDALNELLVVSYRRMASFS